MLIGLSQHWMSPKHLQDILKFPNLEKYASFLVISPCSLYMGLKHLFIVKRQDKGKKYIQFLLKIGRKLRRKPVFCQIRIHIMSAINLIILHNEIYLSREKAKKIPHCYFTLFVVNNTWLFVRNIFFRNFNSAIFLPYLAILFN